jgi:hypothetical protein
MAKLLMWSGVCFSIEHIKAGKGVFPKNLCFCGKYLFGGSRYFGKDPRSSYNSTTRNQPFMLKNRFFSLEGTNLSKFTLGLGILHARSTLFSTWKFTFFVRSLILVLQRKQQHVSVLTLSSTQSSTQSPIQHINASTQSSTPPSTLVAHKLSHQHINMVTSFSAHHSHHINTQYINTPALGHTKTIINTLQRTSAQSHSHQYINTINTSTHQHNHQHSH